MQQPKPLYEYFGDNTGQVSAIVNLFNFVSKYQRKFLPKPKVAKLEAPAGRGKTYVARLLIQKLQQFHITITPMAFTGRAVKQLSKAGISAKTFHSVLFEAVLTEKGDLDYFRKRDIQEIRTLVGQAILIDEGSMVPKDIADILLSLGLPIITMGDSEQLESIEDDGVKFNLLEYPMEVDLSLDTNVRFSEDSGIGQISEHLRGENTLPNISAEDMKTVRKPKIFKKEFHVNNHYDLIVCGTNRTRTRLNNLVREARGYFDKDDELGVPKVGEQVVCLKNTVLGGSFITNGELFVIEEIRSVRENLSLLTIRSIDDDQVVKVLVEDTCWDSGIQKEKKYKDVPICCFTYGYALTCHKVQGSTIRDLLFVDEDVSFFLNQKKYRYTGVSRASTRLTVAK